MGKQKKAVIIGAGIVGLTSAYLMARHGYDVTIIEQNSEPANGTSKANAGQLIYNFGAMGSPAFLRSLPKTILNPGRHGILVGGLYLPQNWPWLTSFITQCTSRAWLENSLKLIKMAHRSRNALNEFRNENDIDFQWRKDGKIILHETENDLAAAKLTAEFQRNHGGKHQIITKEECFEREPALVGTIRKISGGSYLPDAEVGNCRLFCINLANILMSRYNCQIQYNTKVTKLIRQKNQIRAAETSQGTIEADLFIVCAGIESHNILSEKFPGRKPLIGIKGISLTYKAGNCPPKLSVTDAAGKFVMLSLGDKVRIAGYAIFSDSLDINPKHVSMLQQKAISLMPGAAQYDTPPEIWSGLRPQTPDDLPMISQAGADNLFINAGHGSSGWILAFGAAEKLLENINNHYEGN